MARKSTNGQLIEKMTKLRKEIPGIAIRTTLIVGFPGETEEDFEVLCNFVKEMRFERLGVFTYSQEEDTPAARLDNQIDEDIKAKRKDIIMSIQHDISEALTHEKVGRTMRVLIEGKLANESVYLARTYQDSPEIDGQVFVQYEGELISGDYVDVKITGASDYDLIGELI